MDVGQVQFEAVFGFVDGVRDGGELGGLVERGDGGFVEGEGAERGVVGGALGEGAAREVEVVGGAEEEDTFPREDLGVRRRLLLRGGGDKGYVRLG